MSNGTRRRVRYQVAASLDGFIADPGGESDWIVMDPDIDFAALFAQFDTLVMGRHTFETLLKRGAAEMPGMAMVVFSRTLRPSDYPGVTITADDPGSFVAKLRRQPGKDIWLFGGGRLFRALAAAGQVDTVEPAIIPVLLGGGIPFLPPPADRIALELTGQRIYSKSGIVLLEYAVRNTRN